MTWLPSRCDAGAVLGPIYCRGGRGEKGLARAGKGDYSWGVSPGHAEVPQVRNSGRQRGPDSGIPGILIECESSLVL